MKVAGSTKKEARGRHPFPVLDANLNSVSECGCAPMGQGEGENVFQRGGISGLAGSAGMVQVAGRKFRLMQRAGLVCILSSVFNGLDGLMRSVMQLASCPGCLALAAAGDGWTGAGGMTGLECFWRYDGFDRTRILEQGFTDRILSSKNFARGALRRGDATTAFST